MKELCSLCFLLPLLYALLLTQSFAPFDIKCGAAEEFEGNAFFSYSIFMLKESVLICWMILKLLEQQSHQEDPERMRQQPLPDPEAEEVVVAVVVQKLPELLLLLPEQPSLPPLTALPRCWPLKIPGLLL